MSTEFSQVTEHLQAKHKKEASERRRLHAFQAVGNLIDAEDIENLRSLRNYLSYEITRHSRKKMATLEHLKIQVR